MNLVADIKFRLHSGTLNLVDYTRHPVLHATDGRGLAFLQQRNTNGIPIKVRTKAVAYDRKGRVTGVRYSDASVIALALLIQANLLSTAVTVKDTGGTNRSINANSSASALTFVAGTGTTAASFTDNALQTPVSGSSGSQAGTTGAVSGSTFPVTATISNSSGNSITYSEIGEEITVSTYVFLLSHSVFTGLVVSAGGTLACTDTWSFS